MDEQLAELYAKDAETQAQYQKQITAAIDEENKKRAQTFTSFFDSTGDALEKFVTAGLTRSETMAKAARSLATSLIGDAVKGIAGEGSKLLGGWVAGMGSNGGVKLPEGGGLGQALGLQLEKALGLYKQPDKTPQERSAGAIVKSQDALKAALDNLTKSISGQQKAPSAPGGALVHGGGAPSGTDTAALVRKYESGGNYNVGYGGADLSNAPLSATGFPQWPGKMGPSGISHAAGGYQFEPGTWNQYAKPLGITDFSPQSQDRVFQADYAQRGLRDWSSDKPLMAAAGGAAASPSPAIADPQLVSGIASLTQTTQAAAAATTAAGQQQQQATTGAQQLNTGVTTDKQTQDALRQAQVDGTAAARQFFIADGEVDAPGRNVDLDAVAIFDQADGAACRRFRRSMADR